MIRRSISKQLFRKNYTSIIYSNTYKKLILIPKYLYDLVREENE